MNELPPFSDHAKCPKCGGKNVTMRWKSAESWQHDHSRQGEEPVKCEHMRRFCQDCVYSWVEQLPILEAVGMRVPHNGYFLNRCSFWEQSNHAYEVKSNIAAQAAANSTVCDVTQPFPTELVERAPICPSCGQRGLELRQPSPAIMRPASSGGIPQIHCKACGQRWEPLPKNQGEKPRSEA